MESQGWVRSADHSTKRLYRDAQNSRSFDLAFSSACIQQPTEETCGMLCSSKKLLLRHRQHCEWLLSEAGRSCRLGFGGHLSEQEHGVQEFRQHRAKWQTCMTEGMVVSNPSSLIQVATCRSPPSTRECSLRRPARCLLRTGTTVALSEVESWQQSAAHRRSNMLYLSCSWNVEEHGPMVLYSPS